MNPLNSSIERGNPFLTWKFDSIDEINLSLLLNAIYAL